MLYNIKYAILIKILIELSLGFLHKKFIRRNIVMLGIFFLLLVIICVIVVCQGIEFRRRTKEIINFYNDLEKYLIKNSKWSEVLSYPSVFYDIKFQTSEEAICSMVFMITDAFKCFKRQNILSRAITENMLSELYSIQRKLMIFLYSYR